MAIIMNLLCRHLSLTLGLSFTFGPANVSRQTHARLSSNLPMNCGAGDMILPAVI